jgi:hypothetical protein
MIKIFWSDNAFWKTTFLRDSEGLVLDEGFGTANPDGFCTP